MVGNVIHKKDEPWADAHPSKKALAVEKIGEDKIK
jgi:hypothetical protein